MIVLIAAIMRKICMRLSLANGLPKGRESLVRLATEPLALKWLGLARLQRDAPDPRSPLWGLVRLWRTRLQPRSACHLRWHRFEPCRFLDRVGRERLMEM
jgi:hypothetical protein